MKKILSTILALAMMIALVPAAFADTPLIDESKIPDWVKAKDTLNVVTLGGSITIAYGEKITGTGYSARVATEIGKQFRKNINFTNVGVGGTTSQYGLFRLDRDVISQNPDIVMIEYAGNDRNFNEFSSPATTILNNIPAGCEYEKVYYTDKTNPKSTYWIYNKRGTVTYSTGAKATYYNSLIPSSSSLPAGSTLDIKCEKTTYYFSETNSLKIKTYIEGIITELLKLPNQPAIFIVIPAFGDYRYSSAPKGCKLLPRSTYESYRQVADEYGIQMVDVDGALAKLSSDCYTTNFTKTYTTMSGSVIKVGDIFNIGVDDVHPTANKGHEFYYDVCKRTLFYDNDPRVVFRRDRVLSDYTPVTDFNTKYNHPNFKPYTEGKYDNMENWERVATGQATFPYAIKTTTVGATVEFDITGTTFGLTCNIGSAAHNHTAVVTNENGTSTKFKLQSTVGPGGFYPANMYANLPSGKHHVTITAGGPLTISSIATDENVPTGGYQTDDQFWGGATKTAYSGLHLDLNGEGTSGYDSVLNAGFKKVKEKQTSTSESTNVAWGVGNKMMNVTNYNTSENNGVRYTFPEVYSDDIISISCKVKKTANETFKININKKDCFVFPKQNDPVGSPYLVSPLGGVNKSAFTNPNPQKMSAWGIDDFATVELVFDMKNNCVTLNMDKENSAHVTRNYGVTSIEDVEFVFSGDSVLYLDDFNFQSYTTLYKDFLNNLPSSVNDQNKADIINYHDRIHQMIDAGYTNVFSNEKIAKLDQLYNLSLAAPDNPTVSSENLIKNGSFDDGNLKNWVAANVKIGRDYMDGYAAVTSNNANIGILAQTVDTVAGHQYRFYSSVLGATNTMKLSAFDGNSTTGAAMVSKGSLAGGADYPGGTHFIEFIAKSSKTTLQCIFTGYGTVKHLKLEDLTSSGEPVPTPTDEPTVTPRSNLMKNGSFDDGNLMNWTASNVKIGRDYMGGYAAVTSNNANIGILAQTVDTVAGHRYRFYSSVLGATNTMKLSAFDGNSTTGAAMVSKGSLAGSADYPGGTHFIEFTAKSSKTTLQCIFTGYGTVKHLKLEDLTSPGEPAPTPTEEQEPTPTEEPAVNPRSNLMKNGSFDDGNLNHWTAANVKIGRDYMGGYAAVTSNNANIGVMAQTVDTVAGHRYRFYSSVLGATNTMKLSAFDGNSTTGAAMVSKGSLAGSADYPGGTHFIEFTAKSSKTTLQCIFTGYGTVKHLKLEDLTSPGEPAPTPTEEQEPTPTEEQEPKPTEEPTDNITIHLLGASTVADTYNIPTIDIEGWGYEIANRFNSKVVSVTNYSKGGWSAESILHAETSYKQGGTVTYSLGGKAGYKWVQGTEQDEPGSLFSKCLRDVKASVAAGNIPYVLIGGVGVNSAVSSSNAYVNVVGGAASSFVNSRTGAVTSDTTITSDNTNRYTFRESPAEYAESVQTMITAIKAAGGVPILFTNPGVMDYPAIDRDYDVATKTLAENNGIVLLDARQIVYANPYTNSEVIHPFCLSWACSTDKTHFGYSNDGYLHMQDLMIRLIYDSSSPLRNYIKGTIPAYPSDSDSPVVIQRPNLIKNGSFDDGDLNNWTTNNVKIGIDYMNGYAAVTSNSSNVGGLTQTVDTVAGHKYRLYSSILGATNTMKLSAYDGNSATTTAIASKGSLAGGADYPSGTHFIEFTAKSSKTTVQCIFTGYGTVKHLKLEDLTK